MPDLPDPNTHLICNKTGAHVEYVIKDGYHFSDIESMHADWTSAQNEVISDLIREHGDRLDDPDFSCQIIEQYSLADRHWNWLNKAFLCRSGGYIWFLLIAENKVQGACVIYHPKKSRLDEEEIFYVDYVASAYWNRDRPGYKKQFSGIGRKLLAHASQFIRQKFGYRFGFGLHALPTAESFYSGIGMVAYEQDPEKENLRYFEAGLDAAMQIAGGV